MSKKIHIELRPATPEDLKENQIRLKKGQPYVIVEDGKNASGVFVLQGDEDPFVLKQFLDKKEIFVPLINHRLKEYLKQQKDE